MSDEPLPGWADVEVVCVPGGADAIELWQVSGTDPAGVSRAGFGFTLEEVAADLMRAAGPRVPPAPSVDVDAMRAELEALRAEIASRPEPDPAPPEGIAAMVAEAPIEPPEKLRRYFAPDETIDEGRDRLALRHAALRSMYVGKLAMTDDEKSEFHALDMETSKAWLGVA